MLLHPNPPFHKRPKQCTQVDYASKTQLYEGQGQVQLILLIIAGLCVPVLFLGKPLWLKFTHGKSGGHGHDYQPVASDEENADHADAHGHDDEVLYMHFLVGRMCCLW